MPGQTKSAKLTTT